MLNRISFAVRNKLFSRRGNRLSCREKILSCRENIFSRHENMFFQVNVVTLLGSRGFLSQLETEVLAVKEK